jgi:hypothetical protein
MSKLQARKDSMNKTQRREPHLSFPLLSHCVGDRSAPFLDDWRHPLIQQLLDDALVRLCLVRDLPVEAKHWADAGTAQIVAPLRVFSADVKLLQRGVHCLPDRDVRNRQLGPTMLPLVGLQRLQERLQRP